MFSEIQARNQETPSPDWTKKAEEINEMLDYAAHEGLSEKEIGAFLKEDRLVLRGILKDGPTLDGAAVEALFPLAERYAEIALELVYSRNLTRQQVNRLVRVAMQRWDEDPKWNSLVMELVANPDDHAKLDADSLSMLEKNEVAKEYLEVWERAGESTGKVVRLPVKEQSKGRSRRGMRKEAASR